MELLLISSEGSMPFHITFSWERFAELPYLLPTSQKEVIICYGKW